MPRFSTTFDYYTILDVSPTASREKITANYRKLCLDRHPDHKAEHLRDKATEFMQRLNEAYDILSNPTTRQEYDAFRNRSRESPNAQPGPDSRSHQKTSSGTRDYDREDGPKRSESRQDSGESPPRASEPPPLHSEHSANPLRKLFFGIAIIICGLASVCVAIMLFAFIAAGVQQPENAALFFIILSAILLLLLLRLTRFLYRSARR